MLCTYDTNQFTTFETGLIVIDGPVNGTSFRAYVEQFLVPTISASPRTAEATWRGIGTLLDRFKPEECANYLINAGYASA